MGDPSRGYLLELMLTKLRYATAGIRREDVAAGEGVQIIGMSATMPNTDMVAKWLGAELYQTTFRPVPLAKYIKVRHQVLGITIGWLLFKWRLHQTALISYGC